MESTTPSTGEKRFVFRWAVLAIILVVQLQLKAVVFGPAALASPLITSLALTRTEFGLIMSAINVTVVISVVFGSLLVDRAGLNVGLLCGLAVVALGTALQLGVQSLRLLILARVFQGIGIALSLPVLGGLTMACFSRRERPYINTLIVAVGFLGAGAAMVGTAALFNWFGGSWRYALGSYCVSLIATAMVWLVVGRQRQIDSAEMTATGASVARRNSLSQVLGMPVTWTLAVGIFACSWILEMYFSFVPLFLQSRSPSLLVANRLASFLPFSGVAGVIVFGVLARRASWRKPLLCAGSALVILSSVPLFWGQGMAINAGLVVSGFGLAAFVPVSVTYMMSLPRMTPPLLAALVVVENVSSGTAGFISPLAVGWYSGSFGLRNTLALFSWIELLAIFMFLRLPTSAGDDTVDVVTTRSYSTTDR